MASNLKCDLCSKPATVHLTQIVNNQVHKVDLCETCAQAKGVTDPSGFSLADLLLKASLNPEPAPGAGMWISVISPIGSLLSGSSRRGEEARMAANFSLIAFWLSACSNVMAAER